MRQRLNVTAANPREIHGLDRFWLEHTGNTFQRSPGLLNAARDGCLLQARRQGQLQALCALDLESARVVHAGLARLQVREGARLLAETERLATRFGIGYLGVHPGDESMDLFRGCGYRPTRYGDWRRSIKRRRSRHIRRIVKLQADLAIPSDYARKHRLPVQAECSDLVSIGKDTQRREQFMQRTAARAWHSMRRAAGADEIALEPVSAFRSVVYQAGIIRRKLEAGQAMPAILEVSAAPGYSEHHTGRALDITTPGTAPLEEEFESSPAYRWLQQNAARFGFSLSYPRNNRHGIAYEPWHWCWNR